MSIQCTLNQLINIPVKSTHVSAGVISDVIFVKDGVGQAVAYTVTVLDAVNSLYNLAFTPNSEGTWFILLEGLVQVVLDVVAKTTHSIVLDIIDESLGSWHWDKTTGILTLYRQNGSALTHYNVIDTSTQSSRELSLI